MLQKHNPDAEPFIKEGRRRRKGSKQFIYTSKATHLERYDHDFDSFLSRTTSLGHGPELMDASWLRKEAQDVRDFSKPKCKRALPLGAGLC